MFEQHRANKIDPHSPQNYSISSVSQNHCNVHLKHSNHQSTRTTAVCMFVFRLCDRKWSDVSVFHVRQCLGFLWEQLDMKTNSSRRKITAWDYWHAGTFDFMENNSNSKCTAKKRAWSDIKQNYLKTMWKWPHLILLAQLLRESTSAEAPFSSSEACWTNQWRIGSF